MNSLGGPGRSIGENFYSMHVLHKGSGNYSDTALILYVLRIYSLLDNDLLNSCIAACTYVNSEVQLPEWQIFKVWNSPYGTECCKTVAFIVYVHKLKCNTHQEFMDAKHN